MQFIFNHSAAHIRPLLLEVTQYIKSEFLAELSDNEQLLNRCKFIITELCTNAIKHSGEAKSILHVYAQNNRLIIKRSDTGKPFAAAFSGLQLSFPLKDVNDETVTLTLMEDDLNRLVMQRIDNYTASFFTEQKDYRESEPEQKLNEHFGLIIICLSATSFIYNYNPNDGTNTFTASVSFA